jgi:hypothetical protein
MSADRIGKDEIRKLLGGYATNTLTESERSALFEAALDDQELFNALQQEQVLKSLLDDPAARAEVRQALDRPSGKPREAWRLRWWAWGGAVGAVAAAAVLLVVFRPTPATLGERPVEIASAGKPADAIAPPEGTTSPSESKAVANAPLDEALKHSPRARAARGPSSATRGELAANSPAAPAAAPPPVIPPPVQPDTVQQLQQQGPGGAVPGQSGQVSSQGAIGGSAGSRLAPRSPLASNRIAALSTGAITTSSLHYSFLKRDPNTNNFAPEAQADLKPGDLVRIQVSPAIPGRVILSRRNDSGEWQSVAEVTASANSTYVIPDTPIPVPAETQRYRLTLDPFVPLAKDSESRAKTTAQTAPAAAVVIEISLGGKRPN